MNVLTAQCQNNDQWVSDPTAAMIMSPATSADPTGARAYLLEHSISSLMHRLMRQLILHRPAQPKTFLIEHIMKEALWQTLGRNEVPSEAETAYVELHSLHLIIGSIVEKVFHSQPTDAKQFIVKLLKEDNELPWGPHFLPCEPTTQLQVYWVNHDVQKLFGMLTADVLRGRPREPHIFLISRLMNERDLEKGGAIDELLPHESYLEKEGVIAMLRGVLLGLIMQRPKDPREFMLEMMLL